MTLKYTSRAARQLVLQLVLDSIEQRKRSLCLQEIIAMGRKDPRFNRCLEIYFRNNPRQISTRNLSCN